MRHLTLAVLAHVDAGKTTLCEQLLYRTHTLRAAGRVDRGTAFLDSDTEERARGITIYASSARFVYGDTEFTLLDTPGHADFSSEMARALLATDCAVVVISAPAGVQGHTRAIWALLERLEIPTFFFVNKTDLPYAGLDAVLDELRTLGGVGVTDFSDFDGVHVSPALRDALALRDDELLLDFLADRTDDARFLRSARELTRARGIFPVTYGAALQSSGIVELLTLLDVLAPAPIFPSGTPAGVCYQVTRDDRGVRLCRCRLTRGVLRTRDMVGKDKITELRDIVGAKSAPVAEVHAGEIFAAAGLSLRPGDAFGGYVPRAIPRYTPTLTVRVDADVSAVRPALNMLADEEPSISVHYDEAIRQLRINVCGVIQLETLAARMRERFGITVRFSDASVVYLETLAAPVTGRGHFEPLRHYAEVHLRLEPAPRGEGITFRSAVHTDDLAQSWQNLVRTHVLERDFKGVLTGSRLTDVRVTLLAAQAHEKHTEGGDFREATYRALRQGLLKGSNLLLEPYSTLTVEAETSFLGKVLAELQKRGAVTDAPKDVYGVTRVTGRAATARVMDLPLVLAELTRGSAAVQLTHDGYEPVSEPEEIIAACGYNALRDPEEDGNSVFCAHGAGFLVPWDEADRYMHLKTPD
ncbi:MAG: GTP-binding protein [Eubacteriales bacterium]|jgi:ribosomal protection tetracycline resistance protein